MVSTQAATEHRWAPAPSTARSVAALFFERVAATPDKAAYRVPTEEPTEEGEWQTITWRDVDVRVRDIAAGLRALGLGVGERCAIFSATRFEWIAADLAVMCAGGAVATIYASSSAADATFVLQDSQSRFVFAEDAGQVAKLMEQRAELPGVQHVFTFDGSASDDAWVMPLDALEQLGRERRTDNPGEIDDVTAALGPDALATLVYTSGTTGTPKGVETTHDNWLAAADGVAAVDILHADDVQVFWLPLAHSFAKVIEILQLRVGFESAVDGRLDRLVDHFATVQPTFVCAVPRVFEKVFNKTVASAKEGGPARFAIFQWALRIGRRVSLLRQQGKEPRGLLLIEHKLADRLVFSKLRAKFGGRLRFFVSGAAPLNREIAEFFYAAGILVLEGYGLTETSAASFINLPDRMRFGTVGAPLPGTEVRIASSDGEVLVRGRAIMRAYHGHPEATRETIDADGWLHTGDIGELDADGLLRITDCKKDLIKTAGGKYVAPQAIEGRLKARCPYVSQVHVHGNNRPFVTALIALDDGAIRAWAGDNGLGALSYEELTAHPSVKELVQGYVDQVNDESASVERIRRFAILPADLTVESGDLTPTMKVKRKVVEMKYAAELEEMYVGTTAKL